MPEPRLLATLSVDPAILPITPETAACLSAHLVTLACEYDKGWHLNTVTYQLMEPSQCPKG